MEVLFVLPVTLKPGMSWDSQQESLQGIRPSESFADQI